MSLMPPYKCSLKLHIQRANYVARLWRQSHIPNPTLPTVSESGWCYDAMGNIAITWTSDDIMPQKLIDILANTTAAEATPAADARSTDDSTSTDQTGATTDETRPTDATTSLNNPTATTDSDNTAVDEPAVLIIDYTDYVEEDYEVDNIIDILFHEEDDDYDV
jgi:hypothetical protein